MDPPPLSDTLAMYATPNSPADIVRPIALGHLVDALQAREICAVDWYLPG